MSANPDLIADAADARGEESNDTETDAGSTQSNQTNGGARAARNKE